MRFLLLLTLVILYTNSNAQILTLKDFIDLYNGNKTRNEQFLKIKRWELHDSWKDDCYGQIWTYNKVKREDGKNIAAAWLTILYFEDRNNMVKHSTTGLEKETHIVRELLNGPWEELVTSAKDAYIFNTFMKGNTTITLHNEMNAQSTDVSVKIIIMSYQDYLLNQDNIASGFNEYK